MGLAARRKRRRNSRCTICGTSGFPCTSLCPQLHSMYPIFVSYLVYLRYHFKHKKIAPSCKNRCRIKFVLYPWFIPLVYTPGLYPWFIPLVYTPGLYPWFIPLVYTPGLYPWFIPLVYTPGLYPWFIPLVYTLGLYPWFIPLVYTPGLYPWFIPLVYAPGLYPWFIPLVYTPGLYPTSKSWRLVACVQPG